MDVNNLDVRNILKYGNKDGPTFQKMIEIANQRGYYGDEVLEYIHDVSYLTGGIRLCPGGSVSRNSWTHSFISWCHERIRTEAAAGLSKLRAIPDPACRLVVAFVDGNLDPEQVEPLLDMMLARRLRLYGVDASSRRDPGWEQATLQRFQDFVRSSLDRQALDVSEARRLATLRRARPKAVIEEIQKRCREGWTWNKWNPGIVNDAYVRGERRLETYLSAAQPWFTYWHSLSGPDNREIRTSVSGLLGVSDAATWQEAEKGIEPQIASFVAEEIESFRHAFDTWSDA